jgi:hypothetical protein
VALAAQHRLPAVFDAREFAEAGGLMTYGPSVPDSYRHAAVYVDKILNPTATLLEHTLLTQRFTGTSNAVFPRCLRPQNRDSTWANLVDTLK